jgi:hypothetical protein
VQCSIEFFSRLLLARQCRIISNGHYDDVVGGNRGAHGAGKLFTRNMAAMNLCPACRPIFAGKVFYVTQVLAGVSKKFQPAYGPGNYLPRCC